MKFNLNYGAMSIVTLLLARTFIMDLAAMYAYVQVYQEDAYRTIVIVTATEAALVLAATIIAAYCAWKVRA